VYLTSVAIVPTNRLKLVSDPATINSENFLAYVEQVRLPALTPGDIVIIDNAAAIRHMHEIKADGPQEPFGREMRLGGDAG
jgi:hypothetical protein